MQHAINAEIYADGYTHALFIKIPKMHTQKINWENTAQVEQPKTSSVTLFTLVFLITILIDSESSLRFLWFEQLIWSSLRI